MPIRTWEEMRTSIAERLFRHTGHDLDWWNARIDAEGEVVDEAAVRRWLTENGVTGYQQMLLVMERFGYPDYLLASAEELLDGITTAGGGINLRIALASVDDLDDEAVALLRRASDASL